MADVAIVWNEDCKAWVQHLENMLRTEQLKLQIATFEDRSVVHATPAHCRNLIDTTVKIIIISPCFLQYLSDNNLATLKHIITDPELTVLFLCGSIEADIAELKDRFPYYERLKQIKHSNRRELLREAMEMVDKGTSMAVDPQLDSEYLTPPPRILPHHQETPSKGAPPSTLPKPKPKMPPPTPQTGEIKFEIVPDKISCQGSHKVMLSFENEVNFASSGYEIWILGTNGVDIEGVKKFKQRNPYTVAVNVPDRKPGQVTVRLTKDGDTVGTKKLTYEDPVQCAESVLQIYLRIMHEILEAGISNPDYMAMLDQKMTAVLSEQFLQLGPPLNIKQEHSEKLFGMLDYSRSEVSPNEIPTLLHLAAKFGMKDFCNKLVEFSGHCVAASVSNCNNQQPAEIAGEHHHGELEEFLENISVVNEHFYEVMEHYGYTNLAADTGSRQSFETEGEPESAYMDMESKGTAEIRQSASSSDEEDAYEIPFGECHPPTPERRRKHGISSGATDYSIDHDLDIGFRKRTNTISGVDSSYVGRNSFGRGCDRGSKPSGRVRKYSEGSMPVGLRVEDGRLVQDDPRPIPSQRTKKTSVAASWRPHVEATEMTEEPIYEELKIGPRVSSNETFALALQSKLGQIQAERSTDYFSQEPRLPPRLQTTSTSDEPSTYIIPEEQATTHDIFSEPVPSVAYPKYMPQSQRDLVEIGEMFKKKEITQDDVSRLFHDWQERYNKQYSSFVDKKTGLKQMRKDVQAGQEKLKSNGSSSGRPQAARKAKFFNIFSKKKEIIESGQPHVHARTSSDSSAESPSQGKSRSYRRSQSADQINQAAGAEGAGPVLRRRDSERDSGISVHSRHSSVRPISRVDVIAELPYLTEQKPPPVPPRSDSTRRPHPILSPKYH